MKTLSVYTLGQGEEWDAIVRTFKDYDEIGRAHV